jgi:hypothetical protein
MKVARPVCKASRHTAQAVRHCLAREKQKWFIAETVIR